MREMILNHSSVRRATKYLAESMLADLCIGMTALVQARCTAAILRSSVNIHEITISDGSTMFDVAQQLRLSGKRDEFLFFIRLSTKVPITKDVQTEFVEKFNRCEAVGLPAEDGEPLLFCALFNGVSISFPRKILEPDQLRIGFYELQIDGSLDEISDSIDNLASKGTPSRSCIALLNAH